MHTPAAERERENDIWFTVMKYVVQYGGVCWHFPRAYTHMLWWYVFITCFLSKTTTAGTAFTIHVHSTHSISLLHVPTQRGATYQIFLQYRQNSLPRSWTSCQGLNIEQPSVPQTSLHPLPPSPSSSCQSSEA